MCVRACGAIRYWWCSCRARADTMPTAPVCRSLLIHRLQRSSFYTVVSETTQVGHTNLAENFTIKKTPTSTAIIHQFYRRVNHIYKNIIYKFLNSLICQFKSSVTAWNYRLLIYSNGDEFIWKVRPFCVRTAKISILKTIS